MELRLLDRNTPLTIEVLNEDNTPGLSEPFQGQFYDANNNLAITFTCDELYKRYDEFRKFTLRITFPVKGAHSHCFNGKIAGTRTDMFGAGLVDLGVTSAISEKTVRTSPRIGIPLPVNIFQVIPIEGRAGSTRLEFLFEGVSNDISSEGMGLLADYELLPEHGKTFLAEIAFSTYKKLHVDATLKRTINNNRTIAFEYMYGFMFDFTGTYANKTDLTVAIIQHLTEGK